jgi:hypothetical protein
LGGFNVRCTTETPIPQANGTVRFAGQGTTDFIRPYELDFEYEAVLPNVGASYEFIDNPPRLLLLRPRFRRPADGQPLHGRLR